MANLYWFWWVLEDCVSTVLERNALTKAQPDDLPIALSDVLAAIARICNIVKCGIALPALENMTQPNILRNLSRGILVYEERDGVCVLHMNPIFYRSGCKQFVVGL